MLLITSLFYELESNFGNFEDFSSQNKIFLKYSWVTEHTCFSKCSLSFKIPFSAFHYTLKVLLDKNVHLNRLFFFILISWIMMVIMGDTGPRLIGCGWRSRCVVLKGAAVSEREWACYPSCKNLVLLTQEARVLSFSWKGLFKGHLKLLYKDVALYCGDVVMQM